MAASGAAASESGSIQFPGAMGVVVVVVCTVGGSLGGCQSRWQWVRHGGGWVGASEWSWGRIKLPFREAMAGFIAELSIGCSGARKAPGGARYYYIYL
jgi:hypothetical protein